MILNRLITTEGNLLRFRINHTVNGESYVLGDGERYYVAFAPESDPDNIMLNFLAPFNDIEVAHGLGEGRYVFEVSLDTGASLQVIMPALDENHKPLNQLIVLKRIGQL